MSHKAPTPCPTTYCHSCNGRGSWFTGLFWWKTRVECDACNGTGKPTAEDLAKYGKPPAPSPSPPPPPRTYLLKECQSDIPKNRVYLPNLDAPARYTEPHYHSEGTLDRGLPSDETNRQMLLLRAVIDEWAAKGYPTRDKFVTVHDTTELDRA